MDARFMRVVAFLAIATMLVVAAIGVVGCADNSSEEATTDDTTEDSTDDASMPNEEDAIDIAQAYLAAQTDFTSDQFEWAAEEVVQADDGTWYARVTAFPINEEMEIEQIYVYSPADSDGFWFALDMGTGIDPMTDDRFPPEVQEDLTP